MWKIEECRSDVSELRQRSRVGKVWGKGVERRYTDGRNFFVTFRKVSVSISYISFQEIIPNFHEDVRQEREERDRMRKG